MTPLDIISVADAKAWLSASSEDTLERLIGAAISFVEVYTGVKMYSRAEVLILPFCGYTIKGYPLTITSVTDSVNVAAIYDTKVLLNGTMLFAPSQSRVTMSVGYGSAAEVPPVLVEAAYKMLTYMYENRDIYVASLPLDIQFMINKLRRNLA